ncbi:MAG: hypothetical protein ACKO34_07015 [Vampirovibrionales bacterium]
MTGLKPNNTATLALGTISEGGKPTGNYNLGEKTSAVFVADQQEATLNARNEKQNDIHFGTTRESQQGSKTTVLVDGQDRLQIEPSSTKNTSNVPTTISKGIYETSDGVAVELKRGNNTLKLVAKDKVSLETMIKQSKISDELKTQILESQGSAEETTTTDSSKTSSSSRSSKELKGNIDNLKNSNNSIADRFRKDNITTLDTLTANESTTALLTDSTKALLNDTESYSGIKDSVKSSLNEKGLTVDDKKLDAITSLSGLIGELFKQYPKGTKAKDIGGVLDTLLRNLLSNKQIDENNQGSSENYQGE